MAGNRSKWNSTGYPPPRRPPHDHPAPVTASYASLLSIPAPRTVVAAIKRQRQVPDDEVPPMHNASECNRVETSTSTPARAFDELRATWIYLSRVGGCAEGRGDSLIPL